MNMRFGDLKPEYENLFRQCTVQPNKIDGAKHIVDQILHREERYRKVQMKTGVPWSVIALIHSLEANLDFNKHLHNGDPLSEKTRHEPRGRPPGNPPFTWEESAADALQLGPLSNWRDWSIPGVLFALERFNGFGYRKHQVSTPYLWSFSNHYSRGKFTKDGHFDPDAVSHQCGAAVLLHIMLGQRIDLNLNIPHREPFEADVDFKSITKTLTEVTTMEYPNRIIKIGDHDEQIVSAIQRRLNELGYGPIPVNGFFGQQTEAAVKLFQARSTDSHGSSLIIDGELGSISWSALFGADTVKSNHSTHSPLLVKVLETADHEIGVIEQPRGSNRGPQVDQYLHMAGSAPGNSWCAAFVYWCFAKAAQELEVKNPAIKTAGVLDHWNRAAQNHIPRIKSQQASNNPSLITPGMIFMIGTGHGHGHTGLVEKVSSGRLTTIEGNTNPGGSSDGFGVFRRTSRKIANINLGFIDYSHI